MIVLDGEQNFSNLSLDSNSIGIVSIEKKPLASYLHRGHEALVEKAKSICEKVIVYFVTTEVFGLPCFPENPVWKRKKSTFDSKGCFSWAESKGVDVVISQTPTQYEILLSKLDLKEQIKWAMDLYETEKYPFDNSERGELIRQMYYQWFIVLRNFDRQWTHVYCWKDGYRRFFQKHFVEKYTNSKLVLVDPVYTPEGLFYSTIYNILSKKEKDVLSQIPDIMSDKYLDSNGNSSSELLLSSLNSIVLDTGINFYRSEITIGNSERGWVVGEKNDLIQVYYALPEGRKDSFIVYKKGVR
jgi:hypothetical protein